MQGKLLRQALDKFMVSPVAQDARVQVCLPNGEMYDVKGIQLMENKSVLGIDTSFSYHHRTESMDYGQGN